MKKEEYHKKLSELEKEFKQKRTKLIIECAESNNPV